MGSTDAGFRAMRIWGSELGVDSNEYTERNSPIGHRPSSPAQKDSWPPKIEVATEGQSRIVGGPTTRSLQKIEKYRNVKLRSGATMRIGAV